MGRQCTWALDGLDGRLFASKRSAAYARSMPRIHNCGVRVKLRGLSTLRCHNPDAMTFLGGTGANTSLRGHNPDAMTFPGSMGANTRLRGHNSGARTFLGSMGANTRLRGQNSDAKTFLSSMGANKVVADIVHGRLHVGSFCYLDSSLLLLHTPLS